MPEIRPEGIPQYGLIPFKSLPFKPSQELGGCLNEVKAGGFSTVLSTRLCKIPIKKSALPQQRHLPAIPNPQSPIRFLSPVGQRPANELIPVVRRRWLYLSGLNLYSRPHGQLHPRARGNVYSRPRAESGVSAAFSFGCQKSVRKEFLNMV